MKLIKIIEDGKEREISVEELLQEHYGSFRNLVLEIVKENILNNGVLRDLIKKGER